MMRKLGIFLRFIVRVFVKVVQLLIRGIRRFFRFVHRKKRRAIPFYLFVSYLVLVVVIIKTSGDPNFTKTIPNQRINDITQLNPIQVSNIVQPQSIEDIVNAITSTKGPISIGGGKFSMGGQTGYENSLHLDMRKFNKVLHLDTKRKQATVQAGITWRDLQKVIDKENLSVKIMQTYANFTVGGSVSVNCHGRYIGHGPIISSVIELKIITANGDVLIANRQENQEIFNAAIGGYGGIGVIAEVTLQLEENVKVERQTKLVEIADYNSFFNNNIGNDTNVIFQNGDLYPPNYDRVNNISWEKTDKELTDTTRVTPEGESYWLETTLIEVVSWGSFGKWARRTLIDPWYYGKEKVVWRNKEASYDVAELEPSSREKNTYVLQEYFIPVNNIQSFIPKMRAIYDKYDVNVINVSIRHAYPDKESYLSWADEEVFAFVIYYKQGTDEDARDKVKRWTVEMTDAILSENGKWYLPYQPHATEQQFKQAFPNAKKYFEVKNKLDSLHRFNNKLLAKYNPYVQKKIESERNNIKGYFRDEGQTILTVPEWYLVFNPKEYADFLASGENPSEFPFYASIDEYWKLYDRSQQLVSEAYPVNSEYNTMLQVIGVSVTLEYTLKMLYENTIGELFSWFSNDSLSAQEQTITEAHKAYSDFIYHTAWYEFDFLPWIGKVWKANDSGNANWLRKWERTLLFTTEFFVKAGYAKLIEWGAKASYEEPVTNIYMLVSTQEPIHLLKDITLVKKQDEKQLIGITRWGAFTETMKALSNKEIKIHEISGNKSIVVSLLTTHSQLPNFSKAELLYESAVVTETSTRRLVFIVPVDKLLSFIEKAKQQMIEVEHVYDY